MRQTSLIPNALGAVGTLCWCANLLPQIWYNYQRKSTEGLPVLTIFLYGASGVPSGAYYITKNFNLALVLQPHLFSLLYGLAWAQCLIYEKKWRVWKIAALIIVVGLILAALETSLVFAVRLGHDRGVFWPVLVIGFCAYGLELPGIFLILLELLKQRGRVVGMSFVLIGIDWCGAFFSLMALATQDEFDVLFGTLYTLFCLIEIGMVISHLIWMFRTQGIRKRAVEAATSYDDFNEAIRWQAEGVDLRKSCSHLFAWK